MISNIAIGEMKMSTLSVTNEYKPKLIDKLIEEYLESCGAI